MRPTHRAVFTAVLVLFSLPCSALASWPMCRHDPQRTGTASGTSNISSPTPYWKTYLGGSIQPWQLASANLGSGEVLLFATTGTISAVGAAGQQLWQTKLLSISAIVGVADADGDGKPDIVAYSNDQAYVFSATGTVEWAEPLGEIGTMGGVRMGDVNGDGLPDLVIQECGCCGVTSGNPGFIYSFAQGFGSPLRLGVLPFSACGSASLTLVNATGAPPLTTLVADYSHFALISSSGATLGSTGTLGTWIDQSECYAANLDGNPGDEMVCIQNTSAAPSINERSITVLRYSTSSDAGSALTVVWSKVVAPDAGGNMNWVTPVVDLDGDGLYELVYSTDDPINGWVTHVADALTGVELVTPISGQIASGSAAMESANQLDLLTVTSTTSSAWTFTRSPVPAVAMRWSVPGVALVYPVPSLVPLQADARNAVATDLNGDGLADLVINSAAPSTGISAYSGTGGTATQLGSLSLPVGTNSSKAWIVPPLTTTVPQVALARTDGVMNLLDGTLSVAQVAGAPLNISFGGYYASGAWRELFHAPRVAAMDASGHDAVVVDDSREALLRFDGSAASLAIPPARVWEATHTFGAGLQPAVDGGAASVQCLATVQPVTNPPTYEACVLTPGGTAAWVQGVDGTPLNDPVPGDFNGDGVADMAFQFGNASTSDLTTVALSGANGDTLWTSQPFYPGPGGTQSAGISAADWNGDGVPDVVFQGMGTYVLAGGSGSQLATGGPMNTYSLPVLYDTNGDGQLEVTLIGGEFPVSLYSHDLQSALWTSPENDEPYPYGAMVQCPGSPPTPVLVEGSSLNPARLKFTPMNGPSLGSFTTIVLAGGALYPNEAAATAAGAFLGQLTSANAHANLTGQNRPTAVVGSSDGWLYGVNPCAGTLDFVVPFGTPVGEAVFGDTDGDGVDEILVTASDGYLYDLKNDALPAPAYVWDTDPDHGITNHEVSSITTTNKLSAAWGSVVGAQSYEVEVVTTDGTALSKPLWQNIGMVTETSLTGLPLTNGAKYFFAVRAVGANGASPDAESSGVTVHFPTDGGAPADAAADATADATADAIEESARDSGAASGGGTSGGGGCGCRVAAPPGGGPLGALIALYTLLAVRRRSSTIATPTR